MARETKQDRIIRTIFDQVSEHLHDLKTIDTNPNAKELDVERWAQGFLKTCLGFTSSSGYSIRAQETKGKMRPDLIVLKNDKPIFVVEVKKTGFNMNKSDFRSGKIQLAEYLNVIGDVQWGMLTNGNEWKLYDFSQKSTYGAIEVASLDLKDGDSYDFSKKAIEEQCWEILDFHESSYSSDYWRDLARESLAFSPESLARAILASDVIKYIAKQVRGEHDYKANLEALTDKVAWLIENGLDNTAGGWNDTKALELQKYIKSQKRASRKVKKRVQKQEEVVLADSSGSAPNEPHEAVEPAPTKAGGDSAA